MKKWDLGSFFYFFAIFYFLANFFEFLDVGPFSIQSRRPDLQEKVSKFEPQNTIKLGEGNAQKTNRTNFMHVQVQLHHDQKLDHKLRNYVHRIVLFDSQPPHKWIRASKPLCLPAISGLSKDLLPLAREEWCEGIQFIMSWFLQEGEGAPKQGLWPLRLRAPGVFLEFLELRSEPPRASFRAP